MIILFYLMWIEVYTKNILIDSIVPAPTDIEYKLVRMEQNYEGNTIYIFKYCILNDIHYIYTDLEKNMFLQSTFAKRHEVNPKLLNREKIQLVKEITGEQNTHNKNQQQT